jgi:hypothetical protein
MLATPRQAVFRQDQEILLVTAMARAVEVPVAVPQAAREYYGQVHLIIFGMEHQLFHRGHIWEVKYSGRQILQEICRV